MRATYHAIARAQQRGIPPLIIHWLEDFGRQTYDGHGARVLWFDKSARRNLERSVGRESVRRMHEWLNAYAVVSLDGPVITVGRRYKRVKH